MSKPLRKQENYHGLVLPELGRYRIACAVEGRSMAKQTRLLIKAWLKRKEKKTP